MWCKHFNADKSCSSDSCCQEPRHKHEMDQTIQISLGECWLTITQLLPPLLHYYCTTILLLKNNNDIHEENRSLMLDLYYSGDWRVQWQIITRRHWISIAGYEGVIKVCDRIVNLNKNILHFGEYLRILQWPLGTAKSKNFSTLHLRWFHKYIYFMEKFWSSTAFLPYFVYCMEYIWSVNCGTSSQMLVTWPWPNISHFWLLRSGLSTIQVES